MAKVDYTSLVNKINELNTSLAETLKLSKQINTQNKKTQETGDGKELKARNENIKKLNQNTYQLTNLQKERLKQENLIKQNFAKMLAGQEKQNELLVKSKIALQKQAKATQDLTKWQKANKGSIDKLDTANVILRKRLRAVNTETEKGRKRAAALKKVIDRNTISITKQSDAFTRQKRNIGNYGSALKGTGKKLLSFAGSLGLVTGASALLIKGFGVVKESINSTQTSGDKWAVTSGKMRGAYTAFIKTLSTGDWSNLFTNMNEAARLGGLYVQMLDDLSDRTRDFNVTQADAAIEINKLKLAVDNVNLSNGKRLEAAKELLDKEEELLVQNKSIKQQAFDAEVININKAVKLNKDQLINFIKNYDEEKEIREQVIFYLDEEKRLKEEITAVDDTIIRNARLGIITNGDVLDSQTRLRNELKQLPETLTDAQVIYLDLYKEYANSTDEELDRVTNSYVALQGATSSYYKGLRRSMNQYNSLLKQLSKEEVKINEAREDNLTDISPTTDVRVENEKSVTDELYTINKEYAAKIKALAEKGGEELKEDSLRRIELEEQTNQQIADKKIEITQSVGDFIGVLLDNQLLELEQKNKDGLISDEKFAKESAKLRRKQAILNKAEALFNIGLNTAIGVTNAASKAVTLPLIPFIISLGAIQAAAIVAKKIPSFKDGVIGLKGKGTETSDSIDAKLSVNESVISAKGTKGRERTLTAINKNATNTDILNAMATDMNLDPAILNNSSNYMFSDAKMVNAMMQVALNQEKQLAFDQNKQSEKWALNNGVEFSKKGNSTRINKYIS